MKNDWNKSNLESQWKLWIVNKKILVLCNWSVFSCSTSCGNDKLFNMFFWFSITPSRVYFTSVFEPSQQNFTVTLSEKTCGCGKKMENIFTSTKPFLVLSKFLGFFPMTVCQNSMKIKWFDVFMSCCLLTALIAFNVDTHLQTARLTL